MCGPTPSLPACRPAIVATLVTVLAALVLVPSGNAAESEGRYGVVEGRVQALIAAVERLRVDPRAARGAQVAGLIDEAVDLHAWLGEAVPDLEEMAAEERALLLDRTRALLIRRALHHVHNGGAASITLEKTRLDGRGVAVDCLVHTPDAIYEITLRWSIGAQARLRDVQIEGVSVGAADRRRLRRAWDRGALPGALAALDEAIVHGGPGDGLSAPPAVATRTTSSALPAAAAEPPPSRRPPGL